MARKFTIKAFALVCEWFILVSQAYNLASPTNDSNAIEVLMNKGTSALLWLQWYPNATSTVQVAQYPLHNSSSAGIIRGALAHFPDPEYRVTHETATTPWVAYVCCDSDGTKLSLEDNIISSAQDRGAMAALLYSQWSEGCIVNVDYANTAKFSQPFAIFTIRSLDNARTIENAFSSIGRAFGTYGMPLPNNTAGNIGEGTTNEVLPGYLIATAMKGTAFLPRNTTNSTASDAGPGDGDRSDRVFLYVLLGLLLPLCVIGLVVGVKRIGHRGDRVYVRERVLAMVAFGQSQTRALKITRTLLDTFPTMTFGGIQLSQWNFGKQNEEQKPADIESQHGQPPACDHGLTSCSEPPPSPSRNISAPTASTASTSSGAPSAASEGTSFAVDPPLHTSEGRPNVLPSTSSGTHITPGNRDQDIIGRTSEPIDRETCPICINEFEEGDEVRILPCKARHIFHRTCIDSWLLERSSRCPVCRYDFRSLKKTNAGNREIQGSQATAEEQRASNMDSSSS